MKASEFFADRRSSYRGDVIAALTAAVAKVERRQKGNWLILANAMIHLCNRVMESGDIQAWWLLSDLKDELMAEPPHVCIANVVHGSWDDNGYECGKLAVGDSELCAEHLAENGV